MKHIFWGTCAHSRSIQKLRDRLSDKNEFLTVMKSKVISKSCFDKKTLSRILDGCCSWRLSGIKVVFYFLKPVTILQDQPSYLPFTYPNYLPFSYPNYLLFSPTQIDFLLTDFSNYKPTNKQKKLLTVLSTFIR